MNPRRLTPLALVTAISLASAGTAAAEDLAIAIHTDPSHAMFKIGERLKDTIESNTNGELTVTLLGTEVGGERDHLEGASYGEYAIALGGSMPMTLYAPEFAAADLPFVYDSSDQARKIYEGEMGEALNQSLIAKGNMRLVGLSARNPRNLTAKTAVETPEDVSGVRMRVPEIAPWVAVWGEIGALPSPIAWPEVYTSLQTGVIEMQENPVDNIYAGKLYEVQDYVSRTEHVYSFFHWLMNEDLYQEMSDEHRQVVLDAVADATAWGDQLVADGQAELYQKLEEEGMQIVEPDVAAFRQAARPAVEQIAQEYDPAVRDYVLSLIQ
ncbi:TRAP transporter substrate-binding protein [Halomonas denitrificans]|uniref:TRAP transporter substrate-binding protein n=1 Tax=Halomonas denitrificans TaxID=370769 RepID=UPI001CD42A88|nr:TRAP transporter substrate-binding protein [Halomonas denitrificans]MCA0973785.1 TRAP transporter substrate-binding protein [Halomonas denitrificans]